MRAFGFGPARRSRAAARSGEPTPDPTPTPTSTLLPLSTPLLLEGDSNTAWGYQITGWPKQALRLSDGRFYVPVGGDFAVAGATVGGGQGAGSNSLEGRRTQTVAKVQAMVALAGHCVLWFQIGTNGGTLSADLPSLAETVRQWRAAGATVWANTCPTFGQVATPDSYAGGLNAWLTTPGAVDGYVDVNAIVTAGEPGGQTHYTDPQNALVGHAVAARLLALISPASVYADPATGLTVDDFAGTGGAFSVTGPATATGPVPTGWTLGGFGGQCAVTIVEPAASLSGRRAVRLTVTCSATGSDQAVFNLARDVPLSVTTGDVVDGWASVSLVDTSDAAFEVLLTIGGGTFPAYFGAPLAKATWGGDTHVWRTYPVNQPHAAPTVQEAFAVRVLPGQTATFEVAGFAHVVREQSAVIAPAVAGGSAAPVIAPATVGTPLAVQSVGSYAGTAPITLAHAFYVAGTSAGAAYTPVTADAGKAAYVVEVATNAGGSVSQTSAPVTIVAASVTPGVVATTLDPRYNPGEVAYSNGDRTARNVAGNYEFVSSLSTRTTGRFYWEVVNDHHLFGVGVGSSPCFAADCVVLLRSGTVYHDNGFDGGYAGLGYDTDGARVGVDADLDAATVRFRVNGGAWSQPILLISAGPVHAWVELDNEVGAQGTARFAAADWQDAAPAGAGVWAA